MNKSSRLLQLVAYAMLTAIFVFAMAISRNCGRLNTGPGETHSGGDTIDVALIYAPGGFYMYGDTLSGINYKLADAFGKEIGRPVKLIPVGDLSQSLVKLQAGIYDILASMPLDADLKEQFPVSEDVYKDRLVLVQRKDSLTGELPVGKSLDLNGREVHVVAGSPAYRRLLNLEEEIGGDIHIIEEPELYDELLCIQVASGQIPLAVVNEKVAREIGERYAELSYDSSISFTQFQVWVFNPADTVLKNSFDDWFSRYKLTDAYRQLLNEY